MKRKPQNDQKELTAEIWSYTYEKIKEARIIFSIVVKKKSVESPTPIQYTFLNF